MTYGSANNSAGNFNQSSNNDNQSKKERLREKCPYGFDCGSMMLIPGVIAHDCDNLTECTSLTAATGVPWDEVRQPTFDLVQWREEERRYWQEREQQWATEVRRIRYVRKVRQHEAAVLLLQQRGNSQTFESFGLQALIDNVEEALNSFRDDVDNLNRGYIAPSGVEAHIYSVKYPPTSNFPVDMPTEEIRERQRIYYYHKLLSKTAQFEAVQTPSIIERLRRARESGQGRRRGDPTKCKVIHLSHSDDARNIQGRIGIERRNRLHKIQTRLQTAFQALEEAKQLAADDFRYADILAGSLEAENRSE